MNTLKLIAVLAIATGSIGMVLGTGAFTAIEADRFSDVGVADDDEALLGVSMEGGTIHPGDQVRLATVENRFGSNIDSVNAKVVDNGPFTNVVIQSEPDSLSTSGPGSSDEITATVAGDPGTAGEIEIEITASSSQGPSVQLTRAVFVEIEDDVRDVLPIQNVEFFGGGNAQINATEPMDVDIVVWTKDQQSDDFERTTLDDVDTETRLQPQLQGQGSASIAAVYFPEYNVTFIHPELDLEEEEVHPWGAGDGIKVEGEISLGEDDGDSPGDGSGSAGPPDQ